jgi:hypothetical protein
MPFLAPHEALGGTQDSNPPATLPHGGDLSIAAVECSDAISVLR